MSASSLNPVLLLWVMLVQPVFGQLPRRVAKCLPYPTLEQEIKDMQPEPPSVSVRVISVDFDANSGIPAGAQEQISTELQSHTFGAHPGADYLNDIANEIAEVGAREALQDRGYFRTTSSARLRVLGKSDTEVHVVATISAQLGKQYRTGDIRIQSADSSARLTLSPEVLRSLISLQRAELFSVEKLRSSLTGITRAYAREGYIDATVEPVFKIDEDRATIDLILKIDEQVQYRFGSIEIWGLNATTQQKLMQSLPQPGDVFDETRLEKSLKVTRAILPAEADVSSEGVNVRRDLKDRTIAILLDFRTCPQKSN